MSGIEVKIERAKHHIHDLNRVVDAFCNRENYSIVREQNSAFGDQVFRIYFKSDLATLAPPVIGDAVHNLRSALDHLIWQLACAHSGEPTGKRIRHLQFPIRETNETITATQSAVEGVSQEAIDRINALKPYKGGNTYLWSLHQFDIIDKHRLLLAVVSRQDSIVFDVPDDLRRAIDPSRRNFDFRIAEVAREPLKNGAIVLRLPAPEWAPKVYQNPNFTFEVAFNEPGIIERKPIIPALREFVVEVERIVSLFIDLL